MVLTAYFVFNQLQSADQINWKFFVQSNKYLRV